MHIGQNGHQLNDIIFHTYVNKYLFSSLNVNGVSWATLYSLALIELNIFAVYITWNRCFSLQITKVEFIFPRL